LSFQYIALMNNLPNVLMNIDEFEFVFISKLINYIIIKCEFPYIKFNIVSVKCVIN